MIGSLVNGQAGSSLSLLDRGLQYGDGLFETIAVVESRPALWQRHWERLLLGCRLLGIPEPDREVMEQEVAGLIGDRSFAVLKIIVTRGASERGYRPPDRVSPTRILELFSWEGPSTSPGALAVDLCRQRLGEQPGYAGLKHLNRLEQVLAQRELSSPEGIMLDSEGNLVSGTMSNLFLVIEGRLHTPIIDRCGVAGVVRSLVLETARRMRQPVTVRRIEASELEQAEGLFLTSSLLGIVPVSAVAGQEKVVRLTHHPVMEAAAAKVFTADG